MADKNHRLQSLWNVDVGRSELHVKAARSGRVGWGCRSGSASSPHALSVFITCEAFRWPVRYPLHHHRDLRRLCGSGIKWDGDRSTHTERLLLGEFVKVSFCVWMRCCCLRRKDFFKCVFLIFTVVMIYSWCIGDVFGPQRTRVLRGDSSSRVSAQEVCGKFPADFKLMKRFNLISFSPGRTNDTRLEGTVLLI